MSGKSVQNVYTPVGYAAYAPVVCMDHLGNTCPELATRLFQPRPDTGLLLVDELSLNTVRLIKSSVPVQDRATPPAGWHVAADDDLTTTWVRDVPVPTAGAPVQTSSGVRLSGVQVTDTTVRFRVESVPASGGTVLFSRLDWPGYSVSGGGARIDPKAGDGFLVRVQLDGAAQGRTLTLSFTPPHWKGAKLAWLVAVLIGVVWSLAALVHRGRRRRAASAGEGYEPDQDPAVERTVSPAVR
jgi:hypothetical protein